MNKKIQLSIVATVASAFAIAATVQAAGIVTPVYPSPAQRELSFRPFGPEADPYLQHYTPATKSVWLAGKDLRQISINPRGPEADPYFEHRAAPAATAQNTWLPGVDLRSIDLTVPGPEADSYLQHAPVE